MTNDKLAAIRARHEIDSDPQGEGIDADEAHNDRAALLTMVDKLLAERDDPLMRVLPDGSVEMLRCKHCAELQAENDRRRDERDDARKRSNANSETITRLRIANRNCGDEILRLRAALKAAPLGIMWDKDYWNWYDGPRAEALNKHPGNTEDDPG